MSLAIRNVKFERAKQVAEFSPDRDDQYKDGELAIAAYGIISDAVLERHEVSYKKWILDFKKKISKKYQGNYRQKLVIASAMLIAEIERIDRIPNTLDSARDWNPDPSIKEDK